jgi:nucleotide-binding universal stress UspA family protein
MKYLVGYSPDQGGREALALATVLARSCGGPLVVCTVIPETWGPPSPARVDAEYAAFLVENARKALGKARSTLAADIPAEFIVRAAPSAKAGLFLAAQETGSDIIVLGSERSAALGRFAEGGVTTEVLRSADRPVAMAPRGYAPPADAKLKRLTCAFAGTSESQALAERSGELARRFGVPLRLATIVVRDKQMYPTGAGYDAENLVSNQYRRQANAAQQQVIDGWRLEVPVSGVIGDGKTWRAALDALPWEEAEMITIGSSSLGPILRVFLGSNSGKIARNAPVPCLLLPRIPSGSEG